MHIVLTGNPNCGKSTLFNALTGAHQRIGNWPGVTVEKKTGQFRLNEETIKVTDLPGLYSLAMAEEGSQDEQIAAGAMISLKADCVVNVIDACHLERHLYLTSQLLELATPLIVVVNMMDLAKMSGIFIDLEALSKALGCPVIPMQAHKKIGLDALHHCLKTTIMPPKPLNFPFVSMLATPLAQLKNTLKTAYGLTEQEATFYSLRALEGDNFHMQGKAAKTLAHLAFDELDMDILFASVRYEKIHQLVLSVQQKSSDASEQLTAKLDKILLHRYFALPLFFLIMYAMFLVAINIGGVFQDFFDLSTDALFVQGMAAILTKIHAPSWVIAFIAGGIGKGLNTTLTFIPVIASMFFCLSFLESSGYMARAAFVVDKVMRTLGLPGKSFVPMIVGFGCNVPAIMAARTLDTNRDRLLTVLMAPFMSCSARLAIYAVFVAAFFPTGGQNIVFSLYLIGIVMAVFTGFILRKTILKGNAAPLILDLPAYHRPSLAHLWKETRLRLRYFIVRALRVIIPICMLLGSLNALTVSGAVSVGEGSAQSILAFLGTQLTPFFAPMGLTPENWPATVGLLTGMLAKEVVVGSLNTLYAQAVHLEVVQQSLSFDFWATLGQASWSIVENIKDLGAAFMNPIGAAIPDHSLSQPVYGIMVSRFDGKAGAFAYLLFVLLYIPCISTMAAIRQEATKGLMWFSVGWSFALAYAAAVIFYQLARWVVDPFRAVFWIGLMVLGLFLVISSVFYWSRRWERHYVIANT